MVRRGSTVRVRQRASGKACSGPTFVASRDVGLRADAVWGQVLGQMPPARTNFAGLTGANGSRAAGATARQLSRCAAWRHRRPLARAGGYQRRHYAFEACPTPAFATLAPSCSSVLRGAFAHRPCAPSRRSDCRGGIDQRARRRARRCTAARGRTFPGSRNLAASSGRSRGPACGSITRQPTPARRGALVDRPRSGRSRLRVEQRAAAPAGRAGRSLRRARDGAVLVAGTAFARLMQRFWFAAGTRTIVSLKQL